MGLPAHWNGRASSGTSNPRDVCRDLVMPRYDIDTGHSAGGKNGRILPTIRRLKEQHQAVLFLSAGMLRRLALFKHAALVNNRKFGRIRTAYSKLIGSVSMVRLTLKNKLMERLADYLVASIGLLLIFAAILMGAKAPEISCYPFVSGIIMIVVDEVLIHPNRQCLRKMARQ
jgi:hypothetical protein